MQGASEMRRGSDIALLHGTDTYRHMPLNTSESWALPNQR